MPLSARFLQSTSTSGHLHPAAASPTPIAVDSNMVVILAALLCALVCVVGLALVARCAWLRRYAAGMQQAPPSKGLKKKALCTLPKQRFVADGKLADCPICLAEFADGDEIRVLPQCGHGFHVGCVDTWLGTQSSCPSCRRVLVVVPAPKCKQCGAASSAAAQAVETGAKAREDCDAANRFLP